MNIRALYFYKYVSEYISIYISARGYVFEGYESEYSIYSEHLYIRVIHISDHIYTSKRFSYLV
jgi:hypothetical protein